MRYRVVTPVFEGPFDLLLHLVNTHEVDVLEVPLAPVVDAFVAELAEASDQLPLNEVSEFLLVGAILLELKSASLLPGDTGVDDDEELEGWDTRDVLLSRLLECRAYAAAAEVFALLTEQAQRSLPRLAGLDEGFVVHAPDLLAGVEPWQLADAYRRATAVRPEPQVDLSHVTADRVTVAEVVEELARVLPGRGPTTFGELTAHLGSRIAIIVRFLALLELCKLGHVSLGQGRTFGELEVCWTSSRATGATGATGAPGDSGAAGEDAPTEVPVFAPGEVDAYDG